MKINLKTALVIVAAALLTACGGGDDDPPARVAAADIKVAASPTTTAAVVGRAFSFPGGVSSLGTTATTTVAFTSTGTVPEFTIASVGEGTATGSTEFGSCIFRIRTSIFAATHALGVGKTVRIDPCTFTANTSGLPADDTAFDRLLTFQLGTNLSVPMAFKVSVGPDGVVKINGFAIGSISTVPVTGGGS